MSWSAPPSQEREQHGFHNDDRGNERARSIRYPEGVQRPPVLPPPSQLAGPRPRLPPLPDLPGLSRAPPTAAPMPPSANFEPPAAVFNAMTTPARVQHAQTSASPPNIPHPNQTSSDFSFSHPTLFAQRASYQSKNPGTVFEALSPVDYGSDTRSLYPDEDPHSHVSYPAGPVSSFQRLPSSSQSRTASAAVVSPFRGSVGPAYTPPAPGPSAGQVGSATTPMYDRFILRIRQQPLAARACGHGERDRRVIDPPPIVQLMLDKFDPTSKADQTEIQYPFNIMHCALLAVPPPTNESRPSTSVASPHDTTSDSSARHDSGQSDRISRRLMGTLVASPFVAVDPDAPQSSSPHARLSTFFCFPDLSCRQNGRYKLRFTLMKVPMGPEAGYEGTQQQGSVYGSVDSDEFQVHSAKGFPGMTASSRLIKELKRQGLAVPVRKGKDRGRERERDANKGIGHANVNMSGSGSQDDDDEDNTSNERAQKRRG